MPLGANDHAQNSVCNGEHPWEVTAVTRLCRFLCYGSEMAMYDTKEHRLGMESALALRSLLQEGRGCEVVEEVKRLANPSLFILDVCSQHSELKTRQRVFQALRDVCRDSEHLFTFVQYKKEVKEGMQCGIWGRALRKAVSNWYNEQDAMSLALAVTKYRIRGGWSHQDLLRLSHTKPANEGDLPKITLISKYAMKGWKEVQVAYGDKENSEVVKVLSYLEAVEKVKHIADEIEVTHLIEEHRLEREQLLTDHLKSKEVWKALLNEIKSVLRTLGKMTADQVLKPGSSDVAAVCKRIQSEAALKKAKLNPFSILTASENYNGAKAKGKVKWEADGDILKSLDCAFYKCFMNVEPAGKHFAVVVDISTSLSSIVQGTSVSTAVTAAAMAMVIARTEAETQVLAYSEGAIVPCTISADMSLREVTAELVKNRDTLPILWASEKGIAVDMFIIFTNSACWHGKANPAECLRMYRHKIGIFSKLMVCGLTSKGHSIANPAADRGMLDLCGFDLGAVDVIRNLALDLI
ncbi:60 kDa SS-A/Ro ribonucleoprotein-like [Coregonus clupeaformis]|uniref:60 kDa SS-A/Ro ribonucleoprotein-like n=1 Tax=Coregonus clupeaformis TaxID=59861 RepID=UPI001BE0AD47|nr:60 kDa SS-A/Ro ribonucleoprotein-like [Coregonus clupeaformis]